MRMEELAGKEVVNIVNGARLGVIGESDITVDTVSGRVDSIIMPRRANWMNLWGDKQSLVIPWHSIKKIGAEVVIVELDYKNVDYRDFSV